MARKIAAPRRGMPLRSLPDNVESVRIVRSGDLWYLDEKPTGSRYPEKTYCYLREASTGNHTYFSSRTHVEIVSYKLGALQHHPAPKAEKPRLSKVVVSERSLDSDAKLLAFIKDYSFAHGVNNNEINLLHFTVPDLVVGLRNLVASEVYAATTKLIDGA